MTENKKEKKITDLPVKADIQGFKTVNILKLALK